MVLSLIQRMQHRVDHDANWWTHLLLHASVSLARIYHTARHRAGALQNGCLPLVYAINRGIVPQTMDQGWQCVEQVPLARESDLGSCALRTASQVID